MPADGELQFRILLKRCISTEFDILKKSKCVQSGLINGIMMFVGGHAVSYAYFYDSRKAFLRCGLPVFTLTTLLTIGICEKKQFDSTNT